MVECRQKARTFPYEGHDAKEMPEHCPQRVEENCERRHEFCALLHRVPTPTPPRAGGLKLEGRPSDLSSWRLELWRYFRKGERASARWKATSWLASLLAFIRIARHYFPFSAPNPFGALFHITLLRAERRGRFPRGREVRPPPTQSCFEWSSLCFLCLGSN